MPRRLKVYVSQSHMRLQRDRMIEGELAFIEADLNAMADQRSTSLSAATWTTDDDAVVGLSAPTTTAGIAKVKAEAKNPGCATLRCAATFADASKYVQQFSIRVRSATDI